MYQAEAGSDNQAGLRTEGIGRMTARVIIGLNGRMTGMVIVVVIIMVIARQNVMEIVMMTGQNLFQNPISKNQASQRGKGSDPGRG